MLGMLKLDYVRKVNGKISYLAGRGEEGLVMLRRRNSDNLMYNTDKGNR